MSVYTELTHTQIAQILGDYNLGTLSSFEGIAAGIENSNFFIHTQDGNKRYVLTIFERMVAEELPYFMHLMKHLAANGLACPDVMQRHDGSLLFEFQGKQGCIVSCLSGKTLDHLSKPQLHASGRALAQLHVAGADFHERRSNPTGAAWLTENILEVLDKTTQRYGSEAAALLTNELIFQQTAVAPDLPRGVIHGDLFVDNILFDGDQVSGIIDFYYAHNAAFAMDIAISLNAQAVTLPSLEQTNHAQERVDAFLAGYQSIRPLEESEHEVLPQLLRLSALRFWVSRLYDALFPRGGTMTQTKDPEEYHQKLLWHRHARLTL